MNNIPKPLPDSTRELAHLWPLVHLVVELAERHGAPASGRMVNQPHGPGTADRSKPTRCSCEPDNAARPSAA